MTAFGSSPGFAPGDADPAWINLEGAMRLRVAAGLVQIQVSVDNGDGTFNISTVVLNGSLRDTRKGSTTKWPSYNAQGLPINFLTDAKRRQREVDAAQARGRVVSDSPVPVSGGTPNT